MLGPSLASIRLAADKQATAEHLQAYGVPVPAGRIFQPQAAWLDTFAFPAVVKPCDGAGSQDIVLVHSAAEAASVPDSNSVRRIEQYRPGVAASVALLCGPRGRVALPACRQHLSRDGRFRYHGGSLPLEPALAERATRLASHAVDSLSGMLGYVGVDLVAGVGAGRQRRRRH